MKKMRKVVARTYCDFGEAGRETEIGIHYTFKGALSQYKRLWDIYHRLHNSKVWQKAEK